MEALEILKTTQDVFLTPEEFDRDLEGCLTIINYPSRTRKYYVCEYISPALLRRKVKVFVNRQIIRKTKKINN